MNWYNYICKLYNIVILISKRVNRSIILVCWVACLILKLLRIWKWRGRERGRKKKNRRREAEVGLMIIILNCSQRKSVRKLSNLIKLRVKHIKSKEINQFLNQIILNFQDRMYKKPLAIFVRTINLKRQRIIWIKLLKILKVNLYIKIDKLMNLNVHQNKQIIWIKLIKSINF